MKKTLFLLTLSALCCLGFTACSSDDDVEPIVLEDPAFVDDAMLLTFNDAVYEDANSECEVKSIELTESGNFLVTMKQKTTRAEADDAEQTYVFGSFTKDGDNVDLQNWGSLIFVRNGSVLESVRVRTLSGAEFMAANVEWASTSTTTTANLARTWAINSSEIKLYTEDRDVRAVGKEFTDGCNLHSISAFIREHAQLNDSFTTDHKVTNLVFTRRGSLFIIYANGRKDIGTWRWLNESEGILTYAWADPSMGTSFTNGEAVVAFPSTEECTLGLGGQVANNKGEIYDVTLKLNMQAK